MTSLRFFGVWTISCVVLFTWMNPCCQCWTRSGTINQNCSKSLTKLDSHMSYYVGMQKEFFVTHPDTKDSYKYVVGVCVHVGPPDKQKYMNCGVMQYGAGNHTHCIGNVNSAQVARTPDHVWLELTYTKGSNYSSHCSKTQRTARIVFLCDPNIPGYGNVDFLEENKEDNLCYYMFSVASRAVCGYPGNLSVGDIILIIMACLAFIWLVAMAVGMAFKRYMLGAKGWEQIPFLDWYKAFGNLESDGCDLVCRTRSRKLVEYKEPSFGADTDEEDDEKDDNLLPM